MNLKRGAMKYKRIGFGPDAFKKVYKKKER